MAAKSRAPKQWSLTTDETITSYESWRQNLLYILSSDSDFGPFLTDGFEWGKKTSTSPNRGFRDDAQDAPNRKTAQQKSATLDMMLGMIANFCPVIARSSIVKSSTSLASIWQLIRRHYGFQSSGAHFLDLTTIQLRPNERPEDLYQRLVAFFEDNLLTVQSGLSHCGDLPTSDEDMSPSLENTVVCLWLQLIRPGLPQLVKQKYGAELRNKTLASLRPEISTALDSLLEELTSTEDAKVLRAFSNSGRQHAHRPTKSCTLCKAAGRPFTTHFLSECKLLPAADRRAIARSRLTQDLEQPDYSEMLALEPTISPEPASSSDHSDLYLDAPTARRVSILNSPVLHAFYNSSPVSITLDCGATTNMIRLSAAERIGLPVTAASQMAKQADGCTPLEVVGETHFNLTRGPHTFSYDALVVRRLDVDFLAGNPFMDKNDIGVRVSKRQIIIAGREIVHYGENPSSVPTARRAQSFVVRAPAKNVTVLLPGDYVESPVPAAVQPDSTWTLEPRFDAKVHQSTCAWPSPQEIMAVDGHIRVINSTLEPILLKKGEHFAQVHEVHSVSDPTPAVEMDTLKPPGHKAPFSDNISLDPDNILPSSVRAKFTDLHRSHDDAFNPAVAKYNGASGDIKGHVNMGPVQPPQRKGRLPSYNRDKMITLQQKFDELEACGVFARPEDVGVVVEYLNLSFLVQKPSGGSRLVTSFGEVGQYAKPQPSLMPNVDATLRDIARWKYIVKSDLLKSFYQIPLDKASMKYCGVVTPFRGIRVYTRCAMGMPGSETCLEELMSRVLGELVQGGFVAKIADDLYCGGNTHDELLENWSRVLEAITKNNLRLSASKTVICPKSTNILGWIWSAGTLRASPHRIAALSATPPPSTVKGLRSFIGAYKVLSRVLKGHAKLLHPLEVVVAGRQSRELISWSDELLHAFSRACQALSSAKTITLPRPDDELWLVTDGSVKNRGIGATLYVLRDRTLLLAGFFNAKLKPHQVTWLPCELEALSIGAAVQHFAPYVIQSHKPMQVLTDSRPCVQAFLKLCRGEFSNSARVTSFLSTLSRFHARLSHVSGAANLASDFASRNPIECTDPSCQICLFIQNAQEEVVRAISVKDVIDGVLSMPFTNRPAWRDTQLECPDLRRVHSHLIQGTRPSKKITTIPGVKKYLRSATIAGDGLIVVKLDHPFHPARERIVVPTSALHGLLTAIHLKFQHPSVHQMKRLVCRYFFALDMDKAISTVVSNCHQCASLKTIPTRFKPQTSSEPPLSIGTSFAADVMRRCRQIILVLRETVSSFTLTSFITSEKQDDLLAGLLALASAVRPLGSVPMIIRVDCAPGFRALSNHPILAQYNISLTLGHAKNANKNPVAERAIEELGRELLHISPEGGAVSNLSLALATSNLNMRIRHSGLSARETWTQRDQITGEQLPISDHNLISAQNDARAKNHPHSARSKAHGKDPSLDHANVFQVGDLVYIASERDKNKARERYMVVHCSQDCCTIRKFTQSQFRSRTYEVKSSELYHVSPTLLPPAPRPVRDTSITSDSSSATSDSDDSHESDEDTATLEPHDPPTQHPPPVMENIIQPVQSVPTDQTNTMRRSNRKRNPPTWLRKDEWVE